MKHRSARRSLAWRPITVLVALAIAAAAAHQLLTSPAARGKATRRPAPQVGRIGAVSARCGGSNAEVETASDATRHLVYDVWIGCHHIGFAWSADDGSTWSPPAVLPGSAAGPAWDPAIAIGPSGVVYAAFMAADRGSIHPVVDISADHGKTFRVSRLPAPHRGDFGDRDFVAAGPRGQVYVTWDYGPSGRAVRIACHHGGSCSFAAGDLNAVLQRSTDGGRTWSKVMRVAPGFPDSGSVSAPILVDPSGKVDVLFERYRIASPAKLTLGRGHEYFTSSADGGRHWTKPVRLGPASRSLSPHIWWIDGSLAADAAGNLYAAWDTQGADGDLGWLAYSTDAGATWSRPMPVIVSQPGATNILQVAGGTAGTAYLGLLTDSSGRGYAQYLRAFGVARGWRSRQIQISRRDGLSAVWPGDTIGLAMVAGGSGRHRVTVSWGSAIGGARLSQIWTTVVTGLP